jgi:hypothetical protein
MNDFSELEDELKKLRPARPSPVLFARVEEAMVESESAKIVRPDRFRVNYVALGLGLATAAVLVLLAKVNTDHRQGPAEKIAQIAPAPETRPLLPATPKLREGGPARRGGSGAEGSPSSSEFIPAGATQVVYNTRDEGLHFADGSEEPMRRVRYQTHETLQWRNASTGASLRVSYPSEEVLLIPISGQ